MLLPLVYFGNPILRKKGAPVLNIDNFIKQLVADMTETMHANKGIGLAAPQVNHLLQLFITCVPIESKDKKNVLHPGVLKVFINPKILSYSKETWTCQEGCLSIPKLYSDVTRPCSVTIQAQNLEGTVFIETLTDLEARAVMHENDHINGTLFIDRIHGKQRKQLDPFLDAVKKKYA